MSSTGRICASQTLHFIFDLPVRLLILYHKIIDLHVHYLPLSIVMLIFLLICWITKMNNNEPNARLCSKPMLTGKYQQKPALNHHFSLDLLFLSCSSFPLTPFWLTLPSNSSQKGQLNLSWYCLFYIFMMSIKASVTFPRFSNISWASWLPASFTWFNIPPIFILPFQKPCFSSFNSYCTIFL